MLLRRHNLNLLPILRELLRTCSVARTAENVGLSQSTVSAALARLRKIYGDELLAMEGRSLKLTERGQQLIEPAERACLEIETLLRPTRFDPFTETRRFVVETADYVTYLLAPLLAEAFAEQAPHASVHFVDIGADLIARMGRDAFDLAGIPEEIAGGLKTQATSARLFTDEIVVIASRRHKGFQGKLTRKAYEASPHAMFMPARNATSHEARQLSRGGIRHRDAVLVEHFLTLPAVVEGSACLALVQRRLAERFQRSHDIDIHAPPFPVAPLAISAYWAKSKDRDPAHAWFRAQVLRAGERLEASRAERVAQSH